VADGILPASVTPPALTPATWIKVPIEQPLNKERESEVGKNRANEGGLVGKRETEREGGKVGEFFRVRKRERERAP
jgi:hypothetical protein